METLFIKPDPVSDHVQWVVIDAAGNPHAVIRQGSLDQLRDFAQHRRIVCIAPAADVYLGKAILPAQTNRNKYRQAVPYALEEDLAEDPEQLHFALGKEQPVQIQADTENLDIMAAGKQVAVPVAVVNKDRMRHWLDKLAAVGVKPHVLIPETLSLPWSNDGWSVLLQEELALVRTQPFQGFACDLENLELLLNSALETSADSPQQIRIWNHNGTAPAPQLKSEVRIEQTAPEQELLMTLAKAYRPEQSINLLQGEFSFKEEYGRLLRPWRTPAILLGTLVALLFAANITRYLQLSSQNEDLRNQLVASYLDAFPEAQNVPEPRKQMEDKLNELIGAAGSRSELLELLAIIAPEIAKIPAVKVAELNFSNKNLELELLLPNLQVIDQLKQQLDQNPVLQTEIQSASAEGEQIKGRLRVTKR
ncbi:MAG TPA: type II secretion system protein GspL [Gammaproteobacteria bacterium]